MMFVARFITIMAISTIVDALLLESVELINNGIVSVGVDPTKGCTITSFVDLNSNVNMINTADLGREVQPSFYGGPNNYNGCVWNNQEWAWNPIGAGDTYGNPSEVVSLHNDGNSITCTIIPMQWACDNVPCECTFNMTYALKGSDPAVYASVTLVNNRIDHEEYGSYDQEYPAVYVNGFLYRLLTYTGGEPWTHAPIEELDAGFDTFWVPGKVSATENFVAFGNSEGFCVAVYNGGADVSSILAGFFGEKGSGGSEDSATGYMAPTGQLQLSWDTVYTYEFVLVMGNVDDVRDYVYMLHDTQVNNNVSLASLYNVIEPV